MQTLRLALAAACLLVTATACQSPTGLDTPPPGAARLDGGPTTGSGG
jgi:hypothetical protein